MKWAIHSCVRWLIVLTVGLFFYPSGPLSAQWASVGQQNISNRRVQQIELSGQPVSLGEDPLLPGSLSFRPLDTAICPGGITYHLDPAGRTILFDYPDSLAGLPLLLDYRVVRLPFPRYYPSHLWVDSMHNGSRITEAHAESIADDGGTSARSTGRFIVEGYAHEQVGLGRSMSPQPGSTLDLSFHGPVTERIALRGQIVDHSLPFQPSGTTSKVQALERIYLGLLGPSWLLEGGDVVLYSPAVPLLSYSMPVQGLQFIYGQGLGDTVVPDRGFILPGDSVPFSKGYAGVGVAKGQYREVHLPVQEGVQGPYPLLGQHSFTRVMVLANSERVYRDGVLLRRGSEYDYVVDYNLGEITFTARCPIARETRIRVSYQALEQQYTTYRAHAGAAITLPKHWSLAATTYFDFNAPFTLRGTPNGGEDLKLLANVPSDEQNLWVLPTISERSGEYSGYREVDTVIREDGVNRHITVLRFIGQTPEAGASQSSPIFTYVGQGNGDYILSQDSLNRQLFLWVAPIEGKHQGAYTPGVPIRPPTGQTLSSFTLGKQWGRDSACFTQVTLLHSFYRANLLAKRTGGIREQGLGAALKHSQRFKLREGHALVFLLDADWTSRGFRQVQPYRDVEYYRSYGFSRTFHAPQGGHTTFTLRWNSPHGVSALSGRFLLLDSALAYGLAIEQRYDLSARWEYSAKYSTNTTRFKNDANLQGAEGLFTLTRRFTWWQLQLQTSSECLLPMPRDTLWRTTIHPVHDTPRAWIQAALVASLTPFAPFRLSLSQSYRYDWAFPEGSGGASSILIREPQQAYLTSLTSTVPLPGEGELDAVLSLKVIPPAQRHISSRALQTHLLSHVAYRQHWLQHRVDLKLQGNLSAEQVPAWQQHFIRVMGGMGQYAWIDHNGDGQQQLHEFTPAIYRDEANYILQRVPSSVPTLARVGSYQLSLNLSPRPSLSSITRATPWWQRADLSVLLSSSQRRRDRNLVKLLLFPEGMTDSACLQSAYSLVAHLVLNREAWPLQLGYRYALSAAGDRLVQGQTQQHSQSHGLEARFYLPRSTQWAFQGEHLAVLHSLPFGYPLHSDFRLRSVNVGTLFTFHSPHAHTYEWEVKLHWARGLNGPGQRASWQKVRFNMNLTFPPYWTITSTLQYAHAVSRLPRHPATYLLLEGFTTGHNATWELGVSCRITRVITLQGSYHLRRVPELGMVHAGFLSAQATF